MKRLHYERLLALLAAVILWLVIIFVMGVGKAHAQGGGFVRGGAQETIPDGRFVEMWNATGTEIADGTVVMVDTVAAITGPQFPIGKGFKTWTATVGTRWDNSKVGLIVGILIGNCPSYSKGRILVEGFHNNALMDATAITGFTYLRPSLTTAGALTSYQASDSTNSVKPVVGVFQRYKDGTSLRGYVWVKFTQPFNKDGGS